MLPVFNFISIVNQHRWRCDIVYKKDSLTSHFWESTLYDMLKNAISGHWDKMILDKSRAGAHAGVAIRSPFQSSITYPLTREVRIATSLHSSQ